MNGERTKYIRLMDLPLEWARVSGIPPQMVLRNICDWAVADGFPPGAFIDSSGAEIKPFDIYMSFRAATETHALNTGISIGGHGTYHNNGTWGVHLLSEALITTRDVLSFCKGTRTLPPPSLLSGFGRAWAQIGGDNTLAPPPCPEATKTLAGKLSREFAESMVAGLRHMLSDLNEGKRRIGFEKVDDGPIGFEFWDARWRRQCDGARAQLKTYEDHALSAELEALEVQWAAFAADHAAAVSTEPGETPSIASDPTASAPIRRRSAGRPRGSGSHKEADMPLVDEMRQAMVADAGLSCTAAALRHASRAAGGGTLESKAKRLAQRYSDKYSQL